MVQVKKVEVREAIVEAASRLFVEKGYVGTSTNEIGQRAGVAPSAIYTYFDSKLDLFYEVFSPWLKTRLDQLEHEVKSINGHRAKVRRIIEAIWRDIPNEQNFFANNLMQAVSLATPADHYRGELLEWCEQRVARMLKTVEPKPRHSLQHYASLSHVIFMSFNGFVAGAYLGVRAEKTLPAIDTMTDLIIGAPAPSLKPVKGASESH
jgi:AcrR family transcriptional regulator